MSVNRFNIIKHFGEPNQAVTLDGFTVYRQDKIFFPNLGRFVTCAPYDNHFCYDNPSNDAHSWTPMCTCGSPAGIVGFNAYKDDASPSDTGELVVCLSHASSGKHSDGTT